MSYSYTEASQVIPCMLRLSFVCESCGRQNASESSYPIRLSARVGGTGDDRRHKASKELRETGAAQLEERIQKLKDGKFGELHLDCACKFCAQKQSVAQYSRWYSFGLRFCGLAAFGLLFGYLLESTVILICAAIGLLAGAILSYAAYLYNQKAHRRFLQSPLETHPYAELVFPDQSVVAFRVGDDPKARS